MYSLKAISQAPQPRLRCLVADDDPVVRTLLSRLVHDAGFEVIEARDGLEAWAMLEGPEGPDVALLDWMMPGLEGTEICRRVRASGQDYTYLILITSRDATSDVVEGLQTGADDYIRKPFAQSELLARLRVGSRIIRLQRALRHKVSELQQANRHVEELQGLLPICMFCKKVRDKAQVWQALELYLSERLGTKLSHALCQDCLRENYGDILD